MQRSGCDKTEQVGLGKPQKAPFGPWSLLSTHQKRQVANVGRLGGKLEGLADTPGGLALLLLSSLKAFHVRHSQRLSL